MLPPSPPKHPTALALHTAFHADIVAEVAEAVATRPVVVVGMRMNPFPRRARKNLNAWKIEHHYLEYGSYLSMWKPRLAIKLWSGWPTFPQIFVHGVLVGGNSELEALKASGELDRLIAAGRGA